MTEMSEQADNVDGDMVAKVYMHICHVTCVCWAPCCICLPALQLKRRAELHIDRGSDGVQRATLQLEPRRQRRPRAAVVPGLELALAVCARVQRLCHSAVAAQAVVRELRAAAEDGAAVVRAEDGTLVKLRSVVRASALLHD